MTSFWPSTAKSTPLLREWGWKQEVWTAAVLTERASVPCAIKQRDSHCFYLKFSTLCLFSSVFVLCESLCVSCCLSVCLSHTPLSKWMTNNPFQCFGEGLTAARIFLESRPLEWLGAKSLLAHLAGVLRHSFRARLVRAGLEQSLSQGHTSRHQGGIMIYISSCTFQLQALRERKKFFYTNCSRISNGADRRSLSEVRFSYFSSNTNTFNFSSHKVKFLTVVSYLIVTCTIFY